MQPILDQILQLLQEEELLRLGKRAKMAGDMVLAQLFLNEVKKRNSKIK